MSKNKLFLVVVLMLGAGFLVACQAGNLANGQNYYCPDKSYIDIIQADPELQVRFTCTDKEQAFEVVFGGPNDTKLIGLLRDNNEEPWGMGVVLQDGQIVQFYDMSFAAVVMTRWRAGNN